jgi:putative DNA methylase
LEQARELIRLATGGNPPPLLDPFAGGGSIPLEAQRLGLEAHASDLNPVAVMINKALIEIPPKFANMPPVNPRDREKIGSDVSWKGAAGLAADVRYYGEWMRDHAWERIGHLYPKCNGETVIAWIWARTVKCPNPACGAQMPLVRSFDLSKKKGKKAWIEPQVDQQTHQISFVVRKGDEKGSGGTVSRRGATCLACGTPVSLDYIREEGQQGRMKAQLMAIVTKGKSGRNYYNPDKQHAEIAEKENPTWQPDLPTATHPQYMGAARYGMTTFSALFTPRQLIALNTFNELVSDAQQRIYQDALAMWPSPQGKGPFRDNENGAMAYAEAVITYLSLAISKATDLASALCHWQPHPEHLKIAPTFSRHSLPMTWDFAEGNPFSDSSGNFFRQWELISKVLEFLQPNTPGNVQQQDAISSKDDLKHILISTDPPYYDNVPYADLSDFFYVWLRASLRHLYPTIFSTVLVPKSQELIASHIRFDGDKDKAKVFFEEGLKKVFQQLFRIVHQLYPLTVYYAFKQTENGSDGAASTGWETILEGLIAAHFSITGTWPIRTERPGRLRASGSNALASSIVLVCRPRPEDAPMTSRREFINVLRQELPPALQEMQSGNSIGKPLV